MLKALVLVLASTLVPLIALGALAMHRALAIVADSSRRDLQVLAAVTAARLDQLFVDTQRMQSIIASNELVSDALAQPATGGESLQRADTMLRGVVSENPDLALAYLADAKGVCLASTSDGMVGREYLSTRPYMRRALAGERFISEMNVGITTREPGVFFSGPVVRNDTLMGAVVLKLKGEMVDRVCSDVGVRLTSGFAGVADSRLIVISHPDQSRLHHSIGALPPETAAEINPQLDYAVDAVRSLGLDDVARELAIGRSRGNALFTMPDGEVRVLGYARMTQRDWVVFVIQPREVFALPMRNLATSSLAAIASVGVMSAAVAVLATWFLLRPVKELKRASEKAAKGDWSARAEVLSNDEIGDLARSFNAMMPRLQQQSRMQHALDLAMQVQRHLLPDHGPRISGLDVDGVNVAADETGGDYFDFLDMSAWQDGSLAVAVGDVTGHGISAALLMATARGMVRSRSIPMSGLAELMTNVNAHLCADVPAGHFMTLMYALIDRPRCQVRLVSAGHDPILVYVPSTDSFHEYRGSDIALGVDPDWEFHEHSYPLHQDAILVIGTDGIWETFSPNSEQFGTERLKQVVRASASRSASEIKRAILEAVNSFRGSLPQQDDVTVVVIKLVNAELALADAETPGHPIEHELATGKPTK